MHKTNSMGGSLREKFTMYITRFIHMLKSWHLMTFLLFQVSFLIFYVRNEHEPNFHEIWMTEKKETRFYCVFLSFF